MCVGGPCLWWATRDSCQRSRTRGPLLDRLPALATLVFFTATLYLNVRNAALLVSNPPSFHTPARFTRLGDARHRFVPPRTAEGHSSPGGIGPFCFGFHLPLKDEIRLWDVWDGLKNDGGGGSDTVTGVTQP